MDIRTDRWTYGRRRTYGHRRTGGEVDRRTYGQIDTRTLMTKTALQLIVSNCRLHISDHLHFFVLHTQYQIYDTLEQRITKRAAQRHTHFMLASCLQYIMVISSLCRVDNILSELSFKYEVRSGAHISKSCEAVAMRLKNLDLSF